MKRVTAVVFNYERINLFLSSINKIKNFNTEKDQLIIYDCSHTKSDYQLIKQFENENKQYGQIKYIKRRNWGIDQGGKIDFLFDLTEGKHNSEVYFLMQEHFLDTESPYSKYDKPIKNISGENMLGKYKEDIIHPKAVVDIQKIYEASKKGYLTCAPLEGVKKVNYDNHAWLLADGGNFSFTSEMLNKIKDINYMLSICTNLYDKTYGWSLFMEIKIAQIFYFASKGVYDITSEKYFTEKNDLPLLDAGFIQIFERYEKLLQKNLIAHGYKKTITNYLSQLKRNLLFNPIART